ncbi:MAG: hypothetical protein JWP01_551 [Myxococcales bacterium]|nr:hypothetical protein [Myxococcales bacterium]
MKAHAVAWLWLLAACGGSSSSPDASIGDGGIDPVDPDASLCDDGTDGLCADMALCSTDPNCGGMDASPGCVPATLPPAPVDLFAGTTGFRIVRDVAASGTTVFASVLPNGQIANSAVISCPASGCAATPTVVGAIGGDPRDGLLAAFADKVFWARRAPGNTTNPPNQVVRANLDGTGITPLVTGGDSLLYDTRISPTFAVFEDYALVFDVSEAPTSGSGSGPNAGVRAATVDLLSPALPMIRTPRFATSAVTGNDTYFAYWSAPVSGSTAPYDKKIHILDLDGNQLAVTTQTFQYMRRIQLVGNTLIAMGDDGTNNRLYACTLPACSNLHEVGVAVQGRGFDFQIRNGRVYFASVEDPGCGVGLQGVLASCDVASLVGGTCTRQFHSTSFHWVNTDSLEIEDNAAYMSSRTSNTSLFKTAL